MSVLVRGTVLVVALAVLPMAAAGQEPPDTVALSLTDALERALERSEEVRIARAQVEQANAEVAAARSQLLPQVNTQVQYTRTLRSVFQGAGIEIPDSLRFDPDSTASILERLRYLERNVPNAAFGALGGLFSDLSVFDNVA